MVIANSAMLALRKIGDAFDGEAERLMLKTDEDVVALVKEVRRQIYNEKVTENNEDNA